MHTDPKFSGKWDNFGRVFRKNQTNTADMLL
jgi:hypothetical protein